MRAHPDLNQGPADLQSAALTTELCTHVLASHSGIYCSVGGPPPPCPAGGCIHIARAPVFRTPHVLSGLVYSIALAFWMFFFVGGAPNNTATEPPPAGAGNFIYKTLFFFMGRQEEAEHRGALAAFGPQFEQVKPDQRLHKHRTRRKLPHPSLYLAHVPHNIAAESRILFGGGGGAR